MMEYYLSGAALRAAEVLIDSAIWIAFGCFIAAIARCMLGKEKIQSLFGNDGRFGLLIGWGIGMLLPVCSLGVIPVVRELYRAKVKPGTIVAFGLTAPLFNPLSVLYGLSLSDPMTIVIFSAAAMLVVTVLGAVWGRLSYQDTPSPSATESDQSTSGVATSGVRRSVAVLHAASTEIVSWSVVFIAIGILASTAISVAVAHGSLQGETEPDKIFAPVFMAFYVTPVYTTPLLAMSQIGGMFQHGNSVGAAFSLLILGAGVNIGLLCWFGSAFGVRKAISFFTLLLSLTIGLAYAMDKPLYPKGVSPSGHTHAFDVYTHPFQSGQNGLMDDAVNKISERLSGGGRSGVQLLGMLAVIGIGFRILESRFDLQKWLLTHRESSSPVMEVELPTWVIGLVACVGLVMASAAGTYLYYPDSETVLGELTAINTNCVLAARTKDWEGVNKWVMYCDDLSRRLEVGVLLRTGSISEFKRAKSHVYRAKLDELRDDIEAGQLSRVKEQSMELQNAYLQLSRAFRNK